MSPLMMELLNRAENIRRAKEIEALKLRKLAEARGTGCPTLLRRMLNRLGNVLRRADQVLTEAGRFPGSQLPDPAC